jgi:hypothetical protein
LDGRDLTEIGLKGGNLTVDDQRNGKQWTFTNIDLSVTRPKGGGIAVTLGSESVERPWQMRAAMTPGQQGHRIIDIDTQKVSAKDLMLAMRWSTDQYEPDLPLSARIRADVGPDGIPSMVDGRIVVDKGAIIDLDDPLGRIPIDRAEISLDWDATRQALVMPFQIVSGGNRITSLAQFDAPREAGGTWGLKCRRHHHAPSAGPVDASPLILNRFLLKLRVVPATSASTSSRASLQCGSGHRAFWRHRPFQMIHGWRSASPAPHVGCRHEAALADLRRASACLGRELCWAARSNGWWSPPMHPGPPSSRPAHRFPTKAWRSRSSAMAPRSGRWRGCPRFAMPTSTCASPGAPRRSMSAAAMWKFRPAASSRSPTVYSRCRTPSRRRRRPRSASGSTDRCRPPRSSSAWSGCAIMRVFRSSRRPAAERSPRR